MPRTGAPAPVWSGRPPGGCTGRPTCAGSRCSPGTTGPGPSGTSPRCTETADGLTAELHIAATPDGDSALLEAREGTRDALSVELEDVELGDDGELIAAELAAIALVPLPAFSDARIAAERDPGGDDDDDDADVPPTTPPAPPVPSQRRAARAPARLTADRRRVPAAVHPGRRRRAVAAEFVTGGRTAAALNAALANITPTSTTSAATNPVQWLGELWTPAYAASALGATRSAPAYSPICG